MVDFFDAYHALDDGVRDAPDKDAEELVVDEKTNLEFSYSGVPGACIHFVFSFFGFLAVATTTAHGNYIKI